MIERLHTDWLTDRGIAWNGKMVGLGIRLVGVVALGLLTVSAQPGGVRIDAFAAAPAFDAGPIASARFEPAALRDARDGV